MKKTLFVLVFLQITSSSIFAQEGPNKTSFPKFNLIYQFGVGVSAVGTFDGKNAEDYFAFEQGAASTTGIELMYNLSKRTDRSILLSSGINAAHTSARAMKDAFTHYTFNSQFVQIPLLVSLSRNIGEGNFSSLVSLGIAQNFQLKGSYLIKEDRTDNSVTKQSLNDQSLGLLLRLGLRIRFTPDYVYMLSTNFQVPFGAGNTGAGLFTINMGIGF